MVPTDATSSRTTRSKIKVVGFAVWSHRATIFAWSTCIRAWLGSEGKFTWASWNSITSFASQEGPSSWTWLRGSVAVFIRVIVDFVRDYSGKFIGLYWFRTAILTIFVCKRSWYWATIPALRWSSSSCCALWQPVVTITRAVFQLTHPVACHFFGIWSLVADSIDWPSRTTLLASLSGGERMTCSALCFDTGLRLNHLLISVTESRGD